MEPSQKKNPREQQKSITFDFHGVGVRVNSEDEDWLDAVKHDFSFFTSPIESAHLTVSLICQTPRYEELPILTSAVSTPRNITFADRENTYIDYFGKALNIYNHKQHLQS